ncbi:hypothetical protein NMY22_g15954 [Coprinellus aureogranulatus]|nr:hypothetical protein NMY22_g15954 [Coprinellus aureogranulatus]
MRGSPSVLPPARQGTQQPEKKSSKPSEKWRKARTDSRRTTDGGGLSVCFDSAALSEPPHLPPNASNCIVSLPRPLPLEHRSLGEASPHRNLYPIKSQALRYSVVVSLAHPKPQDDPTPSSPLVSLDLRLSHPGRKELEHIPSASTTLPTAITSEPNPPFPPFFSKTSTYPFFYCRKTSSATIKTTSTPFAFPGPALAAYLCTPTQDPLSRQARRGEVLRETKDANGCDILDRWIVLSSRRKPNVYLRSISHRPSILPTSTARSRSQRGLQLEFSSAIGSILVEPGTAFVPPSGPFLQLRSPAYQHLTIIPSALQPAHTLPRAENANVQRTFKGLHTHGDPRHLGSAATRLTVDGGDTSTTPLLPKLLWNLFQGREWFGVELVLEEAAYLQGTSICSLTSSTISCRPSYQAYHTFFFKLA